MRIIHLSDTHLGYSSYNKTEQTTGLNQREADFYYVFNEIVDYILEIKPDLVIHAGDLFDSVRPSNRAIHEAFRQFVRLSRAEIPTVIISGNHSTPRQKTTGSIFRLLEFLDHIYPVYNGEYETIEIGDAKVHAIPHPYSEEMFEENFKKLEADKKFKYNILVTHATVIGVNAYAGPEFKELSIPPDVLHPEFDYIALGHLHRFIKVTDKAFYSGSPERLSFSEAGDMKGFIDVELDSMKVKHVKTKAREMVDTKPIDCAKLDSSQIMKSIETLLPADISGKIVRFVFQDIPFHVHASLDFRRIDELTANALYCEKQFVKKSLAGEAVESIQIGSIGDEFSAFVKSHVTNKQQQAKLEKVGLGYLQEALLTVEEEE